MIPQFNFFLFLFYDSCTCLIQMFRILWIHLFRYSWESSWKAYWPVSCSLSHSPGFWLICWWNFQSSIRNCTTMGNGMALVATVNFVLESAHVLLRNGKLAQQWPCLFYVPGSQCCMPTSLCCTVIKLEPLHSHRLAKVVEVLLLLIKWRSIALKYFSFVWNKKMDISIKSSVSYWGLSLIFLQLIFFHLPMKHNVK